MVVRFSKQTQVERARERRFEDAIKPLNKQQREFMRNYVRTSNARQSAIDAGYAKKSADITAYNILRLEPAVHALMIVYEASPENDTDIMTAREAMEILTRIARGEEKETVVLATEVGTQTVKKEADIKTRIVAIKELLRNLPKTNDALRNMQIEKMKAETALLQKKIDSINGNTDNDLTIELDNEPTR